MKKILCTLMSIMMILAVATGCGQTGGDASSAQTGEMGTKVITNCDGTEVTVPEKVDKIGCLFGPSYEKVVLLGDGVPVYREKVQEILQEQCEFAPASCNRQRAACVAVLGQSLAAAGKTVSSDDFAPEYLRMSQAERERMEADEAHRELMKAGITK